MITVKFNNESYDAYVVNYQTGEAEIKTSLVDIPYADGQLDLTDYYGVVKYKNRTITINMRIFGSEDIVSIHHNIKNALHGKLAKIEFSDDDEGWYWYGRCSVGQGTRVNNYAYDFVITVDTEPYQYQDEETVLTITSNDFVADLEPYSYRTSTLGSIEYPTIVGGSVGWNQLNYNNGNTQTVNGLTFTNNGDSSWTINGTSTTNGALLLSNYNLPTPIGHKFIVTGCPSGGGGSKYYVGFAGLGIDYGNGGIWSNSTSYTALAFRFDYKTGQTFTNAKMIPQVTNLTLALGSTIADYVYSLETATSGNGVTWLKEHFPKMFGQYNAYDSGSIKSVGGVSAHKMVGFNQWDEEWELGSYNETTGEKTTGTTTIRCKNLIPVLPNTAYYFKSPWTCRRLGYDANGNYIGVVTFTNNTTFTTGANTYFITFRSGSGVTTYNNDICINISDTAKNGTYEPYRTWSYPLDSSLTLRGIPKLDSSNNLYYEGDTYASSGTVTRKYGIVDLGTLSWHYEASVANTHFWTAGATIGIKLGGNLICAMFTQNPQHTGYTNIANLEMCVDNSVSAPVLRIKDDAYTDAATFKTAMSGVYLVYELATPTTESATSFLNPQTVGSTEEYVTESIVPVGQDSKVMERKAVILESENAGVLKVANTMPITLKTDSVTVSLPTGTHSVGLIPLKDGENEIEVVPSTPIQGTATFDYSNGRL